MKFCAVFSADTRASNYDHLLEISMTWDSGKQHNSCFAEEFIIIPAACSPNANIFQLNPTLTLVCRAWNGGMCCTRYILINIGNNLPLPQTFPPLRPRASSNEPGSPCSAVCFNKSNYSGLFFCGKLSSHPSWEVRTCAWNSHGTYKDLNQQGLVRNTGVSLFVGRKYWY